MKTVEVFAARALNKEPRAAAKTYFEARLRGRLGRGQRAVRGLSRSSTPAQKAM